MHVSVVVARPRCDLRVQHFDEAMTQDEANILGPSSIYPLGQVHQACDKGRHTSQIRAW